MNEKCPSCGSCGMPMRALQDFGGAKPDNQYCAFCSDAQGTLTATFERVVEYYANDFVARRGLDSSKAKLLAEETVSKLPAWSSRSGGHS